jgi:hypothetical protein
VTAPPRIDRLTEPAVVGRFYLVPTIFAAWPSGIRERAWPIIGPKHNDVEFLDFDKHHYHIDARFVADRFHGRGMAYGGDYFQRPLSFDLPEVIWRPRKMKRQMPPYPFGWRPEVRAIRAAFGGRQCARGKGGWICPHKNAPLGSIAPVGRRHP